MTSDAQVRKFVEVLRESQYWPPEKMRSYQDELLSRLLRHAYDTVPFYRQRLACLYRRNWGPRLHKWNEIPILTRQDIAANHKAMLSEKVPSDHGSIGISRSSGTTGNPIEIARTDLHMMAVSAIGQRGIDWAGINANLRYGVIRRRDWLSEAHPPDGILVGLGAPMAASFGQTGDCIGLRWDTSPEEKARWLKHTKIENLIARPGDFRQIVHAMTAQPELRTSLKSALTLGEPIDPGLRQRIVDCLGVEPIDSYSATEIGYIALQCPEGAGFRSQSEVIHIEIVDDEGRAAPLGTLGRVLVTALYNYAMPLIRYECGDYAIAGQIPEQGRRLPVIAAIAGRTLNRFQNPEGHPYWPSISKIDVERHFHCYAYQLAQTATSTFEFRYVSDHEINSAEKNDLAGHLEENLHPGSKIVFRRLASSPVSKISRKLSVFVNELNFPSGSEITNFG